MEHLTQKQIEDYSQNRLHAMELLAASDHLAECEVCRARIERGMNADTAFFGLHDEAFAGNGQASAHLTSGQMGEYVDKNLSGEEILFVTDHLSSCEQCALAVHDLRAFRNQIAPSLDREYGPTNVAPVVRESWRERFGSLFRVSPVPAFGGAALAVLLLMFIGWIAWRAPEEEKREVVVVEPTPSVEPSPSAAPSVAVQREPVPVVAQLNDGAGVLSLDKDGKLAGADNLPPSYQELVKKALMSQRIERPPQLQGLTRPPSSLMGANDQRQEFSVIQPAGSVLLSDRPKFRWSRLEGATGYVVEIYDDQFKLVTASPELTTVSWTTAQSLRRGRVYSWQVKAIKDGQETTVPRPPAPQAKFRVLEQAKANELARAKRAYGSSHLTLGLLYAEAGLVREAEQEFRLLQRANPKSEIPSSLLRQVRSLRAR
ncbi:MAG TPA: zf-HC2 domain-containing protein [Pyrinomonadaceae bacterium]|nr:zf-HC2 domain-containing protein [Pyrinomonadaceae bacterium]